jgi:hypothetical protein
LDTCQGLARRLLLPVRPRVGADDPHLVQTIRGPNTGAGTSSDHAAALMMDSVAQVATDGQRVNAVCPHVAERHWLDWFVDASGRHTANVARPEAASPVTV